MQSKLTNALSLLRAKLPATHQLWLVFSLAVFLTHGWGCVRLFYRMPGLILRSTPVEIAQVTAYNLFFFLLDGLLITGVLVLASLILPDRKLKDHFAITGTLILFISGMFAIIILFTTPLVVFGIKSASEELYFRLGDELWNLLLMSAGLGLWVLAAVTVPPVMSRKERFSRLVLGFVERTTVLSALFLVLDAIAIFTILIGNLA